MTDKNNHNVFAETDDAALLDAWGSDTPEPRINGVDEGHEFFIVYDENSGEPKPVAGREMTKKFRLMFDVPDAELQSFTASLEEAGFAPVFSRYTLRVEVSSGTIRYSLVSMSIGAIEFWGGT